jgi:hypothetical protein
MDDTEIKSLNNCKQEKKRKYFREYARRWREKNKEKSRYLDKKRNQDPKRKEWHRLYSRKRRKEPEYKIKESKSFAKYREKNREILRDRSKIQREKNKDKNNQYSKEYVRSEHGKKIRKNGYLLRKFGITLDRYNEMMLDCGGCCEICRQKMDKPCVDHNHNTEEVRGLICAQCNSGLGEFREKESILFKAVSYLIKSTWGM